MIDSPDGLIIVDMSNDFVADDGTLTVGKPAQDIVPHIISLADRFLKEDGLIVNAMDQHAKDDPHFELWPPHNISGTSGAELYGELGIWWQEHQRNARWPRHLWDVPKPGYDAFYGTCLDGILKERMPHIKTLHFCGVCTDICVFASVMSAYHRGYKTVVHARGCATFTGQYFQFLEHMDRCFRTEIVP